MNCKPIWNLATVGILCCLSATVSQARTLNWTGGGSDNRWSDSDNWSPNFVPANGDTLVFNVNSFSASNSNDFSSLHLASIRFEGTGNGISIRGNPITVDQDIVAANTSGFGRVLMDVNWTSGGGTLYTLSDGQLEVRGTINLANNHQLIAYTFTTNITISGAIAGNGALLKLGTGSLFLTGKPANSYSGATLIRQGRVHLAKAAPVPAISPNVTIGDTGNGSVLVDESAGQYPPGMSMFIGDRGHWSITNGAIVTNLVIHSPGTIGGPGLLTLNGNVQVFHGDDVYYSYSGIRCPIDLGGGTREFRLNDGPVLGVIQFFIDGPILGSGGVILSGYGEFHFSGPNSYSGLTTLKSGILTVDNGDAFGASGPGNETRVEGGLLKFFGNGITVPEPFVLLGGSMRFISSSTVSGSITISNDFLIRADASETATLSGVISGTADLSFSGGALRLAGSSPNVFTGDLIINRGTLELQKPNNVIAVSGNLVLDPTTNTLVTARWMQLGGINPSSAVTVNGNSLLDFNGNNQILSQLNLNDGGDVQTGAGTLSFTAGGIVNIGTQNPGIPGLQSSASISGHIALPHLDYLTFNVGPYGVNPLAPDPELVIPAIISGAGNIVKTGLGGVRLSGANTFNDAPPFFAGDLLINAGTVVAASPGALGGTAGWTWVQNGGRLSLINNITISDETLYLNSTNAIALDNPGGNNVWTGPVTLARDSGISVNQDWSLFFYGVISGSSPNDLIKTGAGTLVFGGGSANTFSGETFINQGQLHLAKPIATAAVPGALSIGSVAGLTASVSSYESYQVLGNIFVNRNGTLHLNGFTENVDHLYLADGGDVETGTGTLILKSGGSLNAAGGANNDPSVVSGRVEIQSGAVFPINVTVGESTAAQAQLDIRATVSTGLMDKTGNGWLRLAGTNTGSVLAMVNGGTVQIDGIQLEGTIRLAANTRIQGIGTVGRVSLLSTNATLAPGNGVGTITTSNLVGFRGALEFELNGNTPGVTYDQLNVCGLLNLNSLTLRATHGFNSAVGDQFQIINNDGTDAITGTFQNAGQNGKLYIGGELFEINYAGGTGNDVVLTRLITPPPPVLTIQSILTNTVQLTWPTNDPPFRLQSNTNLSGTNWAPVLPLPVVAGTNHIVTNATSVDARFYRLINP